MLIWYIFCRNNQLTFSQLTALDVSNNKALKNLSCDGNQLKCLDVSKNSLLTSLDASDNLLEILKTKNGTGRGMQVNLTNKNLQSAEVDDISWAQR
jgi:Leucine-rich repeat (LRR) protein